MRIRGQIKNLLPSRKIQFIVTFFCHHGIGNFQLSKKPIIVTEEFVMKISPLPYLTESIQKHKDDDKFILHGTNLRIKYNEIERY